MQIRALEAPREARHLWAPASGKRSSEFLQFPNHREGRLARRARWDRELPDWMLRHGPLLTRGLIQMTE
eukprot:2948644-Alexandrium_andersonii.AAC.1